MLNKLKLIWKRILQKLDLVLPDDYGCWPYMEIYEADFKYSCSICEEQAMFITWNSDMPCDYHPWCADHVPEVFTED